MGRLVRSFPSVVALAIFVNNAQGTRFEQPGCDVSGKRVDCFMNSQQSCEAKGCCWSPVQTDGTPWCFKKNAAPSPSCTTSPPCSGHGTCNADKQCTCDSPFLTCGNVSAHDCNIDSSSDLDHCGACGTVCPAAGAAGVVSSKCVNSACHITCEAGFLLCYGKCVKTAKCSKPPLPNCETFHENQCDGDIIVTNSTFQNHRWFTPLKGQDGYLESYQDYGRLVAHAHVVYSADRTSATVQLIALHKNDGVSFTYIFAGAKQATDSKTFGSSTTGPVSLAVSASDGSHLVLEPVDFVWNAGQVNRSSSGDFRSGQKGAIVELFGWPHADIAQECAFLAEHGYLGVKMFPMQEQVMSTQPFQNVLNPWYFMYQPVSYRLQGRMGTRDELRATIRACRSMGVRVYADAVVNHMVGSGNDANPRHRNGNGGGCTYFPNKNSSALYNGEGMSPFYTQGFTYTYGANTDQPPSQEFPAVPYGPTDFHCERVLNSWNDPLDLNAGWLTGLVDLNTEKESVRERIADYLTDLIGIGFSGFRVDAAKHIKPDDMVAIFSKLKRNLGGSLPEDFITWWEVLLGGEKQMLMCDEGSGYNYGNYLVKAFQAAGFSDDEILKIKIWNSGYPTEPTLCGAIDLRRAAIQNDDADQQNPGSSSRDMHDQGCVLIKGCDVAKHRSFEEKLFEAPNGVNDNKNEFPIRLILSSYYWTDGSQGVPDGWSDCSQCTDTCAGCQSTPKADAFDPSSTGYDHSPYTRVHRDKDIISAMRRWMELPN